MTTPDRFARMVSSMSYAKPTLAENVETLLRAEHRAVVRLIKKLVAEIDRGSDPKHCVNVTYRLALTDVLAALARRVK